VLKIASDKLLQLCSFEHTLARNQAEHGMDLENVPLYYIQVVSPEEEYY